MQEQTPTPAPRRILRWRGAMGLTQMSRGGIERAEAEDDFPRRIGRGKRSAQWYEDEIVHWLASRPGQGQ